DTLSLPMRMNLLAGPLKPLLLLSATLPPVTRRHTRPGARAPPPPGPPAPARRAPPPTAAARTAARPARAAARGPSPGRAARRRRAVYVDRALALQHGVVGEHRVQERRLLVAGGSGLRARCKRKQQRGGGREPGGGCPAAHCVSPGAFGNSSAL